MLIYELFPGDEENTPEAVWNLKYKTFDLIKELIQSKTSTERKKEFLLSILGEETIAPYLVTNDLIAEKLNALVNDFGHD